MLLVSGECAHATTYSGSIARVQVQPSPIAPASQTRVSIFTSTGITTACGIPSLYSFDLSNADLAASYQAILLTSKMTTAQVIITGTGTCDAYGIETVSDISML
jgi:hypothetical protein